MRAVLFFFLTSLALAACGGGGPPDTYTVGFGDARGYLGYTSWSSGADVGTILIDDDRAWQFSGLVTVMRHELFHAAGVSGHPFGQGRGHVTPDAIAHVAAIPGVVHLAPTETLRYATELAAAWWNEAIGWEKFAVEP